jgi:hypothetical protein
MPLAFNIPYAGISNLKQAETIRGRKVDSYSFPQGQMIGEKSEIGYVFSWDEYYAPKILYGLQSKGIRTKVANREFKMSTPKGDKDFSYGSIFVSTTQQEISHVDIFETLKKLAVETGVEVFAVATGLTKAGINIGSGNFLSIEKPEILMFVGDGISSSEAGEIWHLLDQRFNMPVTKVEISRFNNMDLKRYNTIIMPSGSYHGISETAKTRLQDWIRNGGNIIAVRSANNWLTSQKIISLNMKPSPTNDMPDDVPYYMIREYRGARNIPGSIFEHNIDITHPVGYGYRRNIVPMFKTGGMTIEKTQTPSANPVIYTQNPLLSGYSHPSLTEPLKGSASIIISSPGRGNVISFVDNPNYRAFWYGTNKLFMNALFFGPTIRL